MEMSRLWTFIKQLPLRVSRPTGVPSVLLPLMYSRGATRSPTLLDVTGEDKEDSAQNRAVDGLRDPHTRIAVGLIYVYDCSAGSHGQPLGSNLERISRQHVQTRNAVQLGSKRREGEQPF